MCIRDRLIKAHLETGSPLYVLATLLGIKSRSENDSFKQIEDRMEILESAPFSWAIQPADAPGPSRRSPAVPRMLRNLAQSRGWWAQWWAPLREHRAFSSVLPERLDGIDPRSPPRGQRRGQQTCRENNEQTDGVHHGIYDTDNAPEQEWQPPGQYLHE